MNLSTTIVEDQFGISKIGKVRTSNQDAILMDPTRQLYLLADGMGGHRGGEVASAMAVNHIYQKLSGLTMMTGRMADEMSSAFLTTSDLIKTEAGQHSKLKGMGTTTICALLVQTTLHIGHVGDSRLYLLSAKTRSLFQLTRDHSLGVEAGIEDSPKRTRPYKNVLTRCMGYSDYLAIDYLAYDPIPGDKVLICSDGLHGPVPFDKIEEILIHTQSCQESANQLISAAYKQGADDNVTVIVLKLNLQ